MTVLLKVFQELQHHDISYKPVITLSTELHIITQAELGDVIRGLYLSKNEVHFPGSRLQEWNLLEKHTENILQKCAEKVDIFTTIIYLKEPNMV